MFIYGFFKYFVVYVFYGYLMVLLKRNDKILFLQLGKFVISNNNEIFLFEVILFKNVILILV